MKGKHWHAMNGSYGCIPDNDQLCSTKEEAVESLCCTFSDMARRGMKTSLRKYHYYSFRDRQSAGADYCEIVSCIDPECLEGEDEWSNTAYWLEI